jgi:hypothetical protein
LTAPVRPTHHDEPVVGPAPSAAVTP